MKKIVIIGSENSHAEAFINLINGQNGELPYGNVKIAGVGGCDAESNKKLFAEHNLEFIADDVSAAVKYADAAMITSRHGSAHFNEAMPFIEAGKPVFVDKPLTIDADEAVKLLSRAKELRVPVCGGSSLKYAYDVLMLKNSARSGVLGGSVAAPLSMVNDYGNFYFYSSHLAEMSLNIFGYNPETVDAVEKNGVATALIGYPEYVVSNHFIDGGRSYAASVYKKTETVTRNIDISLIYKHECDDFINILNGGKMIFDYTSLAIPVFYLNTVEKAFKTGVKQKCSFPKI